MKNSQLLSRHKNRSIHRLWLRMHKIILVYRTNFVLYAMQQCPRQQLLIYMNTMDEYLFCTFSRLPLREFGCTSFFCAFYAALASLPLSKHTGFLLLHSTKCRMHALRRSISLLLIALLLPINMKKLTMAVYEQCLKFNSFAVFAACITTEQQCDMRQQHQQQQ